MWNDGLKTSNSEEWGTPQEIKDLQRWCNNKVIFKKVERFEDYRPTRKVK